jgi:Flp pilus assembly protein TadG
MSAPSAFRRMVPAAAGNARYRSAHGESGSALIEAALSMGILLTLIFGIVEISLAAYTYHFISEAARQATRYAIVRGSSFTTDCTAPTYANCIAQSGTTGDITVYVQNLAFPGIDKTKMTVSSTWLNSDGTACVGTEAVCKAPGNQVQVTITYSYPLNIPFVPLNTWTLKSISQMVISQ